MKKKYPMTELTIRDYFAAKAMVAIIVDPASSDTEIEDDIVAESAYKLADAMMEAREK